MNVGGEALVLAAVLVAVSFVVIPWRYRYWRLLAVLGWSLVWFDSRFTATWADWVGLGIVLLSLASVSIQHRRARQVLAAERLRSSQ
jgi:hypothetical protein